MPCRYFRRNRDELENKGLDSAGGTQSKFMGFQSLNDLREYATEKATLEELNEQNSCFIQDLNNRKADNQDITSTLDEIPEYMQYEVVKLAADMAIENIESPRTQTHPQYVAQLSE